MHFSCQAGSRCGHVVGAWCMPACSAHVGRPSWLGACSCHLLQVSVVYAVAISKPGHGNIGPLAVVSSAVLCWVARCCHMWPMGMHSRTCMLKQVMVALHCTALCCATCRATLFLPAPSLAAP